MHKPITIQNISLAYPNKLCFENFSARLTAGSCVGLIGDNGCGKSTLLKILSGVISPSTGCVDIPDDVVFGYVPQLITEHHELSGGQRFNKMLSQVLAERPNCFLLDEPTNHLDQDNRRSLMRMLKHFNGTSIIATHDIPLLRHYVDRIWHIENRQITIFNGRYDDYSADRRNKQAELKRQWSTLKKQKRLNAMKVEQEQKRAANSRKGGLKKIKNRKWPTVVSGAKAGNAVKTAGVNRAKLAAQQVNIDRDLNAIYQPEKVTAKFALKPNSRLSNCKLSVMNGSVSLIDSSFCLDNIHLMIDAGERLAIKGKNGAGKTTLLKALMHEEAVFKTGEWLLPKQDDIGYLDQHYQTLMPGETVFESIKNSVDGWSDAEVRRYLNDYLFRKNEEVNAFIETLSCGERARLSLAKLAIHHPSVLLLDEITNNVDLTTRQHIIDVLNEYSGMIVVISHDEDFLDEIHVFKEYVI